jgi:GT2 family glycosyltransferase
MRKESPRFYTDDPDYALWLQQNAADDLFCADTGNDAASGWSDVRILPVGEAGELQDAAALLERLRETDASYILLPDGRARLTPALFRSYPELIEQNGGADLIYGDEDLLTEADRLGRPYFKPDWSPDLLESFDYLGPSVLYRRELLTRALEELLKTGDASLSSSFLHRLNLTCAKYADWSRIYHVQKIVCHIGGEECFERYFGYSGFESAERVAGAYEKENSTSDEPELISILIPSKDHYDYLNTCITSIREKTTYPNIEIVVIDNGSAEAEKKRIAALLESTGIAHYVYEPMTFNFSRMCNLGAKAASGAYLVLLNDDVIITQEDWLERMLESARQSHAGAIGVRLLHPDGCLQHCGVGNMAGGPSHFLYRRKDDRPYAFGLNRVVSNALAVTAACLMVKADRYNEVGGLDEALAVAYNDVDFCFKLWERGYYNILRADVSLIHNESASRGKDLIDESKMQRLSREQAGFYRKHTLRRGEDPFYNRNLSSWAADFSIRHDDLAWKRPDFVKQLPGEETNLGLAVDRIDAGEEAQIFGRIRLDDTLKEEIDTILLYVQAGRVRFLLVEAIALTTLLTDDTEQGKTVAFAARFDQRYLTRNRNRIGVILTGRDKAYRQAASPDQVINLRDYTLLSFLDYCIPEADQGAHKQSPKPGHRKMAGQNRITWRGAVADVNGEQGAKAYETFCGLPVLKDVHYHLDELTFTSGYLSTRLWAFRGRAFHNDWYTVQLAIVTRDRFSLRELNRTVRPDLALNFLRFLNLLYSGYYRKTFLPVEIDPESAELWLIFENEASQKSGRVRIR